jgi:CitB family two-component system sensor histidine kinase MalK
MARNRRNFLESFHQATGGMLNFYAKSTLRTKLLLLVCTVVIIPIAMENIHVFRLIDREYYFMAGQQADNVASIAAVSPQVFAALLLQDERTFAEMENYLITLTEISQVNFIVVIKMDGIRLYHPDKDKIGKMVVGGDADGVLLGKSYISSARGTLGFSQRAFRPIYSEDGVQIGAAIVGIMSDKIRGMIERVNRPMRYYLLFSMLFGLLLAFFIAGSVRRILFGLEPIQIAEQLEERNTILRTVREGVIAVNREGRLSLINEAAKNILHRAGIDGDLLGKSAEEAIPSTRLVDIMESGRPEFDSEQDINGITILTNRRPLEVHGEIVGAMATFRDMTEIRRLAENLTGVYNYADALRSQSHEMRNKLHAIYGMLNSGHHEELKKYLELLIGTRLREEQTLYGNIKDPIIAGFLASKYSRAREAGVHLDMEIRGVLHPIIKPEVTHAVVTILGNLIDNGLDAVQGVAYKNLSLSIEINEHGLLIKVRDTGCGMTREEASRVFNRGYSTKGESRGIGLYLVLMSVDEMDGRIELATTRGKGTEFAVSLPLPERREVHNG